MLTDPERTGGQLGPGPARRRAHGRARARLADASFDGIFSSSSIEHFGGPATCAALKEMHRVLRPGGVLSISTEFRIEGPSPAGPGCLMFDEAELRGLLLTVSMDCWSRSTPGSPGRPWPARPPRPGRRRATRPATGCVCPTSSSATRTGCGRAATSHCASQLIRPVAAYRTTPRQRRRRRSGGSQDHRAGRQLEDVDRRRGEERADQAPGLAAQHPRRRHRARPASGARTSTSTAPTCGSRS